MKPDSKFVKPILLLIVATAVSACSGGGSSKKSSSGDATRPSGTNGDDGGTETPQDGQAANAGNDKAVTVAIPDYPALYCKYVGQVKSRADVSQEVSYFCRDGAPTAELLGLRTKLQAEGGHIRPRVLKEKHDKENETSEFILAWGYYVPIRPFEVKARPLYEYIAKNIQRDDLTLASTTERHPDAGLDHGLHLWSAKMNYDLSVKASSGLTLDSIRNTEYNMYQVQSGNEEMGFGVESMTDTDNPDYSRSVMINLSFNDGTGYNDGKGGALVFNLLHIVINNRGFPVTASETINEIGNFLADSMYDGLKK
jgi:hypothetical protein